MGNIGFSGKYEESILVWFSPHSAVLVLCPFSSTNRYGQCQYLSTFTICDGKVTNSNEKQKRRFVISNIIDMSTAKPPAKITKHPQDKSSSSIESSFLLAPHST